MAELGKLFVALGALLVVVGALLWLTSRAGVPLGHLPGDFSYRGRNVRVYFPLGTSIVISLVLTALLYLITHFRR